MALTGTVYTAGPIDQAEIDTIQKQFETILGQAVELAFCRDDSLIGGFRAVIDGKLYDASILAKAKDILGHLKNRE